jgi:hypothetical protein
LRGQTDNNRLYSSWHTPFAMKICYCNNQNNNTTNYKLISLGLGLGLVLCPSGSNGVMKFQIARINSQAIQQHIPLPANDNRFMDDRFQVWLYSNREYESYLNVCNNGTLRFTCEGEPGKIKNFLDVTIFIENNRIETKLYRNPVSKSDFYLNYFSSHPRSTRDSIPYSLALRIIRNCSQSVFQEESLNELQHALVTNSFYPSHLVNNSFEKAKNKTRSELLQHKSHETENEKDSGRSVLSTPFHPTLTCLPKILRTCASALKGINETFDQLTSPLPLVAWNRDTTIKQRISPSKLPTDQNTPFGTFKCHRKKCLPCSDVIEGKTVKVNGKVRKIIGANTCDSKWIIYALCCTVCDVWYVGKTFTAFKTRFSNHKSKLRNKMMNGVGNCSDIEADIHLIDHFCQKHTDLSSLKWVVLHKVGKETNNPASHLLKWEHAYIEHFGCVYPHGLNTNE